MAATPRYDRPDESLAPVRPEMIEALAREIDATDKAWRRGAARCRRETAHERAAASKSRTCACRLPDMTRKPLFGRRRASRFLRGFPSTSPPVRRSALSANPAPARSTLGRALVRLLRAVGRRRSCFEVSDIAHLPNAALRPLRRDLQVIFQDPYSSLNPSKSIGAIIAGPLGFMAWRQAPPNAALGGGGAPRGRFARGFRRALSARTLRRAAPARRHRARHRHFASLRPRRRDRLGSRRLQSGADPRSSRAVERRTEFDARVHQP